MVFSTKMTDIFALGEASEVKRLMCFRVGDLPVSYAWIWKTSNTVFAL